MENQELNDGLETINGFTFQRIDDFEIRIAAPDGEAWRIRYADINDGFNGFIWKMACAMVANNTITRKR